MDATAITGAIASLRAAKELIGAAATTKQFLDAGADLSAIMAKLLDALDAAVSAKAEIYELNQKCAELKKALDAKDEWQLQKSRYLLTEICTGFFAYKLKESARGDEPIHAICATCCEAGRRSVLQIKSNWGDFLFCEICKIEHATGKKSGEFRF